jgi:hypothetical protein
VIIAYLLAGRYRCGQGHPGAKLLRLFAGLDYGAGSKLLRLCAGLDYGAGAKLLRLCAGPDYGAGHPGAILLRHVTGIIRNVVPVKSVVHPRNNFPPKIIPNSSKRFASPLVGCI